MAGGGAGHAGSDGLTAFLAGAGALGGLERAGEPLKAAQLALQLQAPSFLPAEVDDAPQGPPPGGSAPSSPSPVAAGVALQDERGEMRPEPLEAAPQQPQQQRDEAEARQALATARPAPPPQPAEAAPPRAQSYTVTRKELPTATPFPSALQPCPADGTKRTHASPPPAICCKLRARGRPARKRLPLPVPLACSGWLLWASSAPSALRGGGGGFCARTGPRVGHSGQTPCLWPRANARGCKRLWPQRAPPLVCIATLYSKGTMDASRAPAGSRAVRGEGCSATGSSASVSCCGQRVVARQAARRARLVSGLGEAVRPWER